MTPPLSILDLIYRARESKELSAKAAPIAGDLIAKAFGESHDRKPGTLRGSDAGACVRAVYASVHGLDDIPDDNASALFKMNGGTMHGAWFASLLKVALEEDARYEVTLEYAIDSEGFTGHIDALIAVLNTTPEERDAYFYEPWAVVELKSTFVMGAPKKPDDAFKNGNDHVYQLLQSCKYAMFVGVPRFVLVTSSPGGMREDWYNVADWAAQADADSVRLLAALGDVMPEGDPKESWRCSTCRVSICPSNKNALREVA